MDKLFIVLIFTVSIQYAQLMMVCFYTTGMPLCSNNSPWRWL